jgi:hypothetical protein
VVPYPAGGATATMGEPSSTESARNSNELARVQPEHKLMGELT